MKNSKSLSELRKQAIENSSLIGAVHDSVICVSCGRFGSTDERVRVECKDLYLLAAGIWLKRPEGSFGKGAREIANILHAGAKVRVDCDTDVIRLLFDKAVELSSGFEAQEASNAIWAAASLGMKETRVINALARACVDRVREYSTLKKHPTPSGLSLLSKCQMIV